MGGCIEFIDHHGKGIFFVAIDQIPCETLYSANASALGSYFTIIPGVSHKILSVPSCPALGSESKKEEAFSLALYM